MPHVDYESAWLALSERLREKAGWGAKELHAMMAEVAAEHRVPESFIQKIVRLYGDNMHISITPETGAAVLGESSLTDESKSPDPEASSAIERSDDESAGAGAESQVGPRRDSDATPRGRSRSRDQVTV